MKKRKENPNIARRTVRRSHDAPEPKRMVNAGRLFSTALTQTLEPTKTDRRVWSRTSKEEKSFTTKDTKRFVSKVKRNAEAAARIFKQGRESSKDRSVSQDPEVASRASSVTLRASSESRERSPEEDVPEAPPPPIYHLLRAETWAVAGEDYYPSTYDRVGFVHCCDDPDLLLTLANAFYKQDLGEYICLQMDQKRLRSKVVYEPPDPPTEHIQEDMPHIYGPIERSSVLGEYKMARGEDGTFIRICFVEG